MTWCSGTSAGFIDTATAKIVAGEAADAGAAAAHQVHGAMGMTREHDLQLFTRRLWSWSTEFGSATAWNERLGEHVADCGADELWPLISAVPR